MQTREKEKQLIGSICTTDSVVSPEKSHQRLWQNLVLLAGIIAVTPQLTMWLD